MVCLPNTPTLLAIVFLIKIRHFHFVHEYEPRNVISNNIAISKSVDSDEAVQSPLKLRNSKFCSVSSLSHRMSKLQATALVRLPVCAGWS